MLQRAAPQGGYISKRTSRYCILHHALFFHDVIKDPATYHLQNKMQLTNIYNLPVKCTNLQEPVYYNPAFEEILFSDNEILKGLLKKFCCLAVCLSFPSCLLLAYCKMRRSIIIWGINSLFKNIPDIQQIISLRTRVVLKQHCCIARHIAFQFHYFLTQTCAGGIRAKENFF